MSLKENLERNCFDQCNLGVKLGKSNGIASCKVTVQRKSAEHLLFNYAFTKCCKAAVATDAHDNSNKSAEKGFTLDTPPPHINECALGIHNCERDGDQYQCVNIPGSYHCVKHVNSLPTPLPKIEAKEFHTTTSEIIAATPTIVVSTQTASTYITLDITSYRSQLPTLLEKSDNKIYDEQPGFISVNISNEFSANKITKTVKEYEPLFTLESTVSLQNLPKSIEADETYEYSEVTEVPEIPTLPKLSILNIGEKTASSQKLGDDSALVNTEEMPKNEWSQINETSTDCQIGFEMDSLGLCFDIDECVKGTHLCDQYQNCFNTNGSHECRCKQGFELDSTAGICVDVDECATGDTICGPLQVCTNLPGGYTCSCPAGHKLVGNHACEDVNECDLRESIGICSENADCINTVGSYQCRCHQGFKIAAVNDKVCVDVDECINSRPSTLCQHRCNNVWGGYRCSCHRGYRLNPADNHTCTDIDECTEFKHKKLCIGRCLNEPGSYRCSCPSGYRLSEDKRSCVDIDECKTGEGPCATGDQYNGSSVVCLNTRGGYQCLKITCPPGYKVEGRHRCNKIETYCPVGDWECFHQPGIYSYNYITFVSNLYFPESKLDLFTMKGPSWPYAKLKFELRVVDVDAPPSVTEADINDFLLTQTDNQAVTSLVRSLEGPQTIELELLMELYSRGQFGGSSVAKLFIFVSEYEF
ncbi:unnamed protein product, partial [Brenthis ino]